MREFWIEFSGDPIKDAGLDHRYVSGFSFEPLGLDSEVIHVREVGPIDYKNLCEELSEALSFYADKKNWYDRDNLRMVIASIDTEGDDWCGGFTARRALEKYKKAIE